MNYLVADYENDWTHPLPDEPKDVWSLRVELERVMHQARMALKDKNVRDPHTKLRKSSPIYRAHIRLATRLNLLLRYYGFEGGRRKPSPFDYLPGLYSIASTLEDLSPEENDFLDWVEMFIEERTGQKVKTKELLPDMEDRRLYSEIREEVLANFSGDESDMDAFDDSPEYWVAQDEWHTERIRRQRDSKESEGSDGFDDFDDEADDSDPTDSRD